jgi:hypothetical protein
MIRWRVTNVIKGFSRDCDHVRLANFERVRGFDVEWKPLCRPPENNLPQFAPLGPTGISALTVPTLLPLASTSAM